MICHFSVRNSIRMWINISLLGVKAAERSVIELWTMGIESKTSVLCRSEQPGCCIVMISCGQHCISTETAACDFPSVTLDQISYDCGYLPRESPSTASRNTDTQGMGKHIHTRKQGMGTHKHPHTNEHGAHTHEHGTHTRTWHTHSDKRTWHTHSDTHTHSG